VDPAGRCLIDQPISISNSNANHGRWWLSSVRNLVALLRVRDRWGREQVMAPQTHRPAEEAEVDFGEFSAVIGGSVMKLFVFCLRLSGRHGPHF